MDNKQNDFGIQGIGGGVNYVNQLRFEQLTENLKIQDMNLEKALAELDKARDIIGSPGSILGSTLTKHGEIAERLDIAFGNADSEIRGGGTVYTKDMVGRTDPVDYQRIEGDTIVDIQSKFVQKNLSMGAVLEHLDKYPEYIGENKIFRIPKDYYEQIQEWRNLSPEELAKLPKGENGDIARRVMEKVHELEEKTGKPFEKIVEPSQMDYSEVQLNEASNTIDKKEEEIKDIDKDERDKLQNAAKASLKEGLKTAGISAAISGAISFITALISTTKVKNRQLSELSKEDWKEIFEKTGIGAVKGGVSGGAIYVLTNVAGMSAPFAAGLVSATLGIATESLKLYRKEVSFDDYMCNMVDMSKNVAVSGLGAYAGQILIPVPVVGAVIGSVVASSVMNLINNDIFGGGYYELARKAKVEKEYSDAYKALVVSFDNACSEWAFISNDINRRIKPALIQNDYLFEKKISELHDYIERI